MRPLIGRAAASVFVGAIGVARLGAQAPQPAGAPSNRDSTVARYCTAWGEHDHAARAQTLRDVWAAEGVYLDPSPAALRGRAALSAHIDGFLRESPGAHIQCSAPQGHHQFARFTWTIKTSAGGDLVSGMDFAEFDATGRIRRIVGFFGAPPGIAPR